MVQIFGIKVFVKSFYQSIRIITNYTGSPSHRFRNMQDMTVNTLYDDLHSPIAPMITNSRKYRHWKKTFLHVAFISSHRSRWQVLVVIDSACVSWAAQKKQPHVSTQRCWHPSQTPGSLFAHLSVSSPGLRVRLVYHPLVCDGRTISAFPTSVGKDLADGMGRGGRIETCPHHIF